MAFVKAKQHKQYETLHFPGPSIDYNICWLSSNLGDTQRIHGRIQIYTTTADTGSGELSPDQRSSWVAQEGYNRLTKNMCINQGHMEPLRGKLFLRIEPYKWSLRFFSSRAYELVHEIAARHALGGNPFPHGD